MPVRVRLAEVLDERGVNLSDLARRTGLTRVALSRLAGGHCDGIRFSTLEALCHALACTPGDLLHVSAPGERPAGERRAAEADSAEPLTVDHEAVLLAVTRTPGTIDDIADATGSHVVRVVEALQSLELAGWVCRRAGGRYEAAPRVRVERG